MAELERPGYGGLLHTVRAAKQPTAEKSVGYLKRFQSLEAPKQVTIINKLISGVTLDLLALQVWFHINVRLIL